jgi:hypothetical protein
VKKRITLCALAVALTGCSAIPNSGPIVAGPRVDVARNDGYVRVIARPPTPGMSAEELVRGFLNACASVADGDATARRYLTPEASAAWNSGAQTEVYDAAALTVKVDGNDKVLITAPLLGTIDARHRYHVADPGSVLTDELHVAQSGGEWRINVAPKSLYLGQGDVARSFRAHPVYFLNPSRDRLVPEYLMLPLGTSNIVAALVRAVIAGPSSAGMTTASLGGATLQFANTVVPLGSAVIGFDRRIMNLSSSTQDALTAQLTWTLTGISGVSTVRLQVDGQNLPSSDGSTAHTRAAFASFDPSNEASQHTLLYVRGDHILSLVNGVPRLLHSGDAAAEATISPDGRTLIAVTSTRKLLYTSVTGGLPSFVAAGSDLAAVTTLSSGEAWFVDREARGRLLTWQPGTGVLPVDTGLRAHSRILDFAVAPDGIRIAMVINDGIGTTVRVGTIVRDASGVHVTGISRVEQQLTSAVAVAWAGESTLGVLGAVGAVAVQPISIVLPLGTVTLNGGPANAVSLAAVPGANMIVGDQAGQLWEYREGRWYASELGIAPSYAR